MKTLKLIKLTAILSSFITLQACGPTIPRSELSDLPPLVEVVSLKLNTQQLKLRVSHRNRLTRKDNQLSCQLALKDFTPLKFNRLTIPDLTNYAKETIDVQLDMNLLNIGANQDELPYVLDCYIYSENFRDEQVIKKATLFKIPGTVDEFR